GVPLAAVADDGDLLALEQSEVRVLVVIDLCGHALSLPFFLIRESDHPRVVRLPRSLRLFDFARGLRLRPARYGDLACPADFLDAHRLEQLDERFDLALFAGPLEAARARRAGVDLS